MNGKEQGPTVHLRYQGESRQIPQAELDVGTLSADADIKRAVADHLGVGVGTLRDYVVERHENGNITIRPEAVFG